MTSALLTVKDVAALLNVSVRTVEQLVAERQLVPVWVRRARRFLPSQVDAYVRANTGRPRRRGGR